jgi:Na+-translocating ferredoxin:NAD+ oxidoreductase RnfG subunit
MVPMHAQKGKGATHEPHSSRRKEAHFFGTAVPVGALWVLTKLALFFAAGDLALAERYLSAAEAQKVCFPQADHFEARTVRLSPEQSRAIKQKAGVKVRDREARIWLARKGTNLLGVLVLDRVFGKHDLIDYAVALSPEGKVLQVEILEYREHYGGEIRAPKWREQFKGKSATSKLKLNDDIYNISGATISCRNVTDGVRRVLATFELVLRAGLSPGDGLPDARTARP